MIDMSFITHLLEVLDQIKIHHWQTKCYARHIATDNLYSKLAELTDEFVEVYIYQERPVLKEGEKNIRITNMTDEEGYDYLLDFALWLKEDLKKIVDDSNSISLNHILEEMSSLVNQTLYLFTFK